MSYEFDSHKPIYLQLVELFSQLIAGGAWAAGMRVASVRDLAMTYGVNPNTLQRALSELEREGLMYTERTNGRFITEDQQRIDSVRQQLAQDRVEQFIQQMSALSCSKDELIRLIDQKWGNEDVTDRNQES